jgi:hypothetical protein
MQVKNLIEYVQDVEIEAASSAEAKVIAEAISCELEWHHFWDNLNIVKVDAVVAEELENVDSNQ